MSQPDHGRVSELFLAARKLPRSAWSEFLDRACGGQDSMRREVEALLAHDDAEDGFLETPAVDQISLGPSRLPDRIGDYQVLGVIGEGGMGMVFLAEQQRPRRRVALKAMKSAWASPRMIRRFEHEAQTLARLQHPGIAQIIEASVADTPSGPQPFFAMEYVEGQPITEFARTHALPVRDRLALMIRVCEAVQHAHHHGVIHRDLKPANILVVKEGTKNEGSGASPLRAFVPSCLRASPKILDFGIARVIDPDAAQATMLTQAGELVGTLPYMSPEQIGGDAAEVDTRSDVYALGLILYEILANRPAHHLDRSSLSDAARVIRDEDPAPLGSIDLSLKGDLEVIVGKAIEKDRTRRYQSAGELAAELERYLGDQPIIARPASRIYQWRKFARRNRALVAGVCVAFLALGVGAAAATWQALRAQREAHRAEQVNLFLRQMFAAIDPHTHGRDVLALDVVKRAEGQIEPMFGKEPLLEADVRNEVASIYLSLGAMAEAEPHFERALEIRRRELGEAHPDTLASLANLGSLRSKQARHGDAEPLLRAACAGRRSVLGDAHPDTLATMSDLAAALLAVGKVEEAEALCRTALPEQQRVHGDDHANTLTTIANLANILQAGGRLEEAESLHERAVAGLSNRLGPDHPTTLISVANLAGQLKSQKRYDEAEPLQRRVVKGLSDRLGPRHPDALIAGANLAMILWRQERLDEAEAIYRRVLDDAAVVFGKEHHHVATLTTQLALVLETQGKLDEAVVLMKAALDAHRKLYGDDHARTRQVGAHVERVEKEKGKAPVLPVPETSTPGRNEASPLP